MFLRNFFKILTFFNLFIVPVKKPIPVKILPVQLIEVGTIQYFFDRF